jgi:hypothetical protein
MKPLASRDLQLLGALEIDESSYENDPLVEVRSSRLSFRVASEKGDRPRTLSKVL